MLSETLLLITLLRLIAFTYQKEEIHYYDDPDVDNDEQKQRDRNISYHNWARQIEKDVLSKISYKIAPYTSDQQIDVQFIFHSVDHISISEKEQVMSISGRYCMIWRDPHITWDPSKYNNIDTLHAGSFDVWTPKIAVLNGLSGVYSHLDAPVTRVKLFVPHFRANEPAYVITCPRYTGRVGCSLDMTNYPHDKHVCSIIMTAKDQRNVVFYAGRRMQASRDLSVNLRHVLTRNDTRPRVSGWEINNITTGINFYDFSNITTTRMTRYSITVPVQSVYFSRHEPAYVYTQTVPALIFAAFNVAGALVQDSAHSMFLFLICLLFQGLFIRDFIDRIPLHYNSLPRIRRYLFKILKWWDIQEDPPCFDAKSRTVFVFVVALYFFNGAIAYHSVQFLIVQLFLSAFGFVFVTAKEVLRTSQSVPSKKSKFPATLDGWTRDILLQKIFSIAGSYFIIILASIVMFLL